MVKPSRPPPRSPTSSSSTPTTSASANGYRTATIGKWHLGWDWPIPADKAPLFKERKRGVENTTDAHREAWKEVFSKPIGGGPITRGFDLYFGTDVPNWPLRCRRKSLR